MLLSTIFLVSPKAAKKKFAHILKFIKITIFLGDQITLIGINQSEARMILKNSSREGLAPGRLCMLNLLS